MTSGPMIMASVIATNTVQRSGSAASHRYSAMLAVTQAGMAHNSASNSRRFWNARRRRLTT